LGLDADRIDLSPHHRITLEGALTAVSHDDDASNAVTAHPM